MKELTPQPLKLKVKNLNVEFILNTDKSHQHGQLVAKDYETETANNVVIWLINNFNKEPQDIQYISSSPYWFFHDLAHSIYTPELFTPKVIAIPVERELDTYKRGVELAREYKLLEEFITSESILKENNILAEVKHVKE